MLKENLLYQTLFFEGSDALGGNGHFNFFAVNNNSLSLEIRFPDFFSVALREADIVSVLLALAGNITYLHKAVLYLFYTLKSTGLGIRLRLTLQAIFCVIKRLHQN
jgi:hypothetical protein